MSYQLFGTTIKIITKLVEVISHRAVFWMIDYFRQCQPVDLRLLGGLSNSYVLMSIFSRIFSHELSLFARLQYAEKRLII